MAEMAKRVNEAWRSLPAGVLNRLMNRIIFNTCRADELGQIVVLQVERVRQRSKGASWALS